MQPTIDQMVVWARHAGGLLRDGYGKRHEIHHKGQIDLVTEMDHLSEDYLLGQIRDQFPDHAIDTEESGQLNGTKTFCWYIDPLDGTTNYAHHMPVFSVSIAFAELGKLRMGVVYDPMRDECFTAERGKGAFLDGEPIHVSDTWELLPSLMVTGFAYDPAITEVNLRYFAHMMRLTQGVRRMGSAALDLCYVASGRFDAYWEQSVRAWDMAAGSLIVEEAGGLLTSLSGDTNYFKMPFSILAANPHLHPKIIEAFKAVSLL